MIKNFKKLLERKKPNLSKEDEYLDFNESLEDLIDFEEKSFINSDFLRSEAVDIKTELEIETLSNEKNEDKALQGEFKYTNKKYKQDKNFKRKAIVISIFLAFGFIGSITSSQFKSKIEEDKSNDISNLILLSNSIIKLNKEKNNLEKLNLNVVDLKKYNKYQHIYKDISDLIEFIEKYKNINEVNNSINKNIEDIIKSHQEILKEINNIQDVYIEKESSVKTLDYIYKLKEKINGNINILVNFDIYSKNVEIANKNREEFKEYLVKIINGNNQENLPPILTEAIKNYNQIANIWNESSKKYENLNSLSKFNVNFLNFEKNINFRVNNILEKINLQKQEIAEVENKYINIIYILFRIMMFSSLILLIYLYIKEIKKQEKLLVDRAEENNQAILKLLNEMSYLQKGDLTKKTSIEETITANIATSINETIDSLDLVVRKIKTASLLMKNKTKEINDVSEGLLFSTEHQNNSILEVNQSIKEMLRLIELLSEKTQVMLETSENSANKSLESKSAVNKSIDAMSIIDKNMEETVLMMNKVSSSSKQISEVIQLLSDITEETNILALNASVQAAKAGEAGKGFKIVADAIHELADNAGEATKRVSTLIANVQTDIDSVEVSIKKTTSEIQVGVKLSEDVGESLNKINDISSKLSQTIKEIASNININAEIVKQINGNMSNILTVTEETRRSAKNTTQIIGEIDNISSELDMSVKSFKIEES